MPSEETEATQEIPLRDRPMEEIVGTLRQQIGSELVAFAMGEDDGKTIRAIGAGRPAGPDLEDSLRDLAEVTEELMQRNDARTVKGLMVGMNPELGDQAPLALFRDGRAAEVVRKKAFLDTAQG